MLCRLHLDTRAAGLAEREVEIRQMTLWACVIYDKYVIPASTSGFQPRTNTDQILGPLPRTSDQHEEQ